MTQDLEKAKKILNKRFCFMEWQASEARERGQELMDENDIKFLLSLEGISTEDVLHCFDIELNKLLLLKTIERAKNEGKKGIIFGTVLGNENQSAVEQRGYFTRMTGHGSSLWDEVYLSEEAFIMSDISHFKNLFGSFASVAPMI